MMAEWSRLRELFDQAADLPAERRRSWLLRACGNDEGLRARVEELLRSDHAAGEFLEKPVQLQTQSITARPASRPPVAEQQLGPYVLREKLGEGGMGVVFAADQVEPIRRRVAIKLIKRGLDTDNVLRRFEMEKQALALMDHPHIARVLDAGASADGRPYFVMEYVSGIPITRYCDEQRLSLDARLGLFIDCCNAIQHAHQKGIIHRDIKPSNALVMIQDDRPVVKMIDFGVAKAVDHRLSEETLYTEQGVLIGTPEYMSPEQAEMSALNVDTRTDVYSLGVLLYELLSGTLPFDPVSLRGSGLAEIQRKIRELEPLVPSARLSGLVAASPVGGDGRQKALGKRPGDALTMDEIAWRRRISADGLRKALRGDLDWIAMKAMEKDRTRRYSTAAALALDVERFLRGEAVEAGPPTASYRLRKFVRRNRGAVIGAALVAISLVVGMAGTTWGLMSARHNEQIALDAARRADRAYASEQDARKAAETEAANARFVATTAARQASYASRRLAEMLPVMRRGADLAGSAPAELSAQYPEALLADSKAWLERLLPELLGPEKDSELLGAILDCGRASAPIASGRRAAAWVLKNREKIDSLLAATERYRFRSSPEFGDGESQLWQALLPEIDGLRAACATLQAAAVAAHLSGDSSRTLRCLAAQRRLAVETSFSGTMVSVLSEYSFRQATYQDFRWFVTDIADRGEVPADFAAFLRTDRPVPSPAMTTVFDGLALRQIVAGVFVRSSNDLPPVIDREAVERLLPSLDQLHTTWPELLASDYKATLAALDAFDQLTELLGQASVGAVDAARLEALRSKVAAQPLLRPWAHELENSMRGYVRLLMERDAAILTLAVAQYRGREQRWPETLEAALQSAEVQPLHYQYLREGFVYRIVDGRPLLYHPGFDGVDNGGIARARALADDKPQTDIIFLGDDSDVRPTSAWLN